MMLITALLLLLAITCWMLKSGRRRQPRTRMTRTAVRQETHRSSQHHAVSINPGGCSCDAVNAVTGERYLTRAEVPNLPLLDCTSANCTCRYVHHEDRRSNQGNRRAAYSVKTELYGLDRDQDRRKKGGRRASDRAQDIGLDGELADIQWTT
jgi:ABC-type nickel/cobalt efflux system permease component RcnA